MISDGQRTDSSSKKTVCLDHYMGEKMMTKRKVTLLSQPVMLAEYKPYTKVLTNALVVFSLCVDSS